MPRVGTTTVLALAVVGLVGAAVSAATTFADSDRDEGHKKTVEVVVPGQDRFTPFAVTIRAGQRVEWINRDTDDHTVVSDARFDSADHAKIDHLLPGTDSNHGQPGTFELRFDKPGTFVYYCRFHAHLDAFNQPIAPGPRGGIQDSKGNFGTPMMGVITVLPSDDQP